MTKITINNKCYKPLYKSFEIEIKEIVPTYFEQKKKQKC